jgi:hypothetical protein
MGYKVLLKVRDEERQIESYNYSCHIIPHDHSDIQKIISLHINAKNQSDDSDDFPLDIEGDMIQLSFNSTSDDQFFYDWLLDGAMHRGEIHFMRNEVETADVFSFVDCFCVGLEETMSIGGLPMQLTIWLSPGVIKRVNLEPRAKVWKVSELETPISVKSPSTEEPSPVVTDVCFKDNKTGKRLKVVPLSGIVTIYAKTENTRPGDIVHLSIKLENGKTINISDKVNRQGFIEIKDFDIYKE